MSAPADDLHGLLPLYVLGALDAAEVERLERALAADPALARALAALEDAAAALIPVAPPPPAVLARLQASVGGGPLERFARRMAALFDVTLDRARELLGLVERPASWEHPIPGLGLGLVHFQGGPAWAAADCGFVRLDPGVPFPLHTHAGEEVSLILAGALRDRRTGERFGPGDELTLPAGSEHDVVSDDVVPCLYAARVVDGIEIAGVRMRPHKP